MEEFTPTERDILAVLSDGMPHSRTELHACLPDELGGFVNLRMHISRMRKKLRPAGQDITSVNGIGYQLVRLLASFNAE